ncbi:MAG: membrane protein insertase YidC [Acidimicrobiales bacterium]
MAIFNNLIDFVAGVLAGLYSLPIVGGSYGLAIMMLTGGVMIVLMPLTLKATRSTIKMQAVQPELRRLQKEHKGDRETMNAEMMALYQENGINPVGGCLPMFAQLPVFLVLFRVLQGITRHTADAPFFSVVNDVRAAQGLSPDSGTSITPAHIGHDTAMFADLSKSTEMGFGPFDLAAQAGDVIQNNFLRGLPYIVLILFVVGTSFYQQKQVSARRKDGDPSPMNQQQQMLLKFLPLMSGIWSFFFPAGLVLYWATSNVFRIGQQAYITHQIYGKEMADGGKLSAPPKKPTPKAASAKPSTKAADDDADTSRSAKGDASANGSTTSSGKRSEEWDKRRAAKAQTKKSSATQSDRITPKGTKPQDPRAKNKKNRKR